MNKRNEKIQSIVSLIDGLNEDQIDLVIDEIFSKISSSSNPIDESVYSFKNEPITFCKKCGSIHFVKNGKDINGHTRYLCRDCGKTFCDATSTVVSGTHKNAKVWKQYIKLLLEGASINKCAEECNIARQTAFVWRHKIINAITKEAFIPQFDGVVEIDEMFINISYKGNHKNSKHFTMPRPAYKRGSDNRVKDNNSKACVLCVVERNKKFSATIPCRGLITTKLLSNIFDKSFSTESIVLTDGFRSYHKYFSNTDTEHIVLPSNAGKAAVKGPYHLNNVNALHKRFRGFLAKYNGVATKYLGNYLSLFLWLENHRFCDRNMYMFDNVFSNGTYIKATELSNLAPTPNFAPAA